MTGKMSRRNSSAVSFVLLLDIKFFYFELQLIIFFRICTFNQLFLVRFEALLGILCLRKVIFFVGMNKKGGGRPL